MEVSEAKPKPKLSKKWVGLGLLVVAAVVGGVVAAVVVTRDDGNSGGDAQGNRVNPLNSGTVPPTVGPSESPSDLPSLSPSVRASDVPSTAPSTSQAPTTSSPSLSPSMVPSEQPSMVPSLNPTITQVIVPVNPVPDNPPQGYFNYDMNDDKYGPHRWNRVNVNNGPLREFSRNGFGVWKGHWNDKDPLNNRCDGPARQQSPKNLVEAAGGREPGWCDAGHEIRSKCGSYPLNSDEYERQILPHKLSLVMNRRPCLQVDQDRCQENNPPIADYPRYSSSLSSYSDLINFDVKVPGEHTLEGVRFDAEIQMLHTHVDHRRISSIGVPVRATGSGYNEEFQAVLDEFQWAYERDANECAGGRRNLRRSDFNATGRGSRWEHEFSTANSPAFARRELQRNPFNPYTEAFMPDINFYRYDGSTTDPPCFPLTWWVMIEPMIISFEQLNQIKYLLFTHVDGQCRKTSVHNENQEVVRPIQPLGDERGIQYCPKGSFESDEQKGRGDGNKCRAANKK